MQGLGEVADVNKCDIKKLSCSAGNIIRFSVMNGFVFNGNNLTLFCAKKQKRNGKNNKEMDTEVIHPGVQDGSPELLLHTRGTLPHDL